MTENPYFKAVEAITQSEADEWFDYLMYQARKDNPYRDYDGLAEAVVADLMFVAGHYGPRTQQLAGQLYIHKSPYRR